MNINKDKIIETIEMIEKEKLDVRTITMGISLLDCHDSNGKRCREKFMTRLQEKLKIL